MAMTGKKSLMLAAAGLLVLAAPALDAEASGAAAGAGSAGAGAGVTVALPEAEVLMSADAVMSADEARDVRPIDVRNIEITREIPETRWLPPGDYIWDAEAAAEARGRTIVVVNIRSRTLSAYKGGIEIGRSSILYGYGAHPTPLGTFPVMQKKRDHISNIYNAPMPHMLRLTNDGIAVHGSERVADDAATHGCVGLPKPFAALLFDHVRVGDRVVIWSGRPGQA